MARVSGFALTPCAMTLNSKVKATVGISVVFPGKRASNTMIAKTMLASPRGPNQPMNSRSAVPTDVPEQAEKHRHHADQR